MPVVVEKEKIYTCVICEEEIPIEKRYDPCPNCQQLPPHNPIPHFEFKATN
jgi:predicted RNA-binding Zn-ribbon protein involved in translation (DUF1610 family)